MDNSGSPTAHWLGGGYASVHLGAEYRRKPAPETLRRARTVLMPFSEQGVQEGTAPVLRGEGMYCTRRMGEPLITPPRPFCARGALTSEIAEAVISPSCRTLALTPASFLVRIQSFRIRPVAFTEYADGLNRGVIRQLRFGAVDTGNENALILYPGFAAQAQRQVFVSRERDYHGVNLGGVALGAWQ